MVASIDTTESQIQASAKEFPRDADGAILLDPNRVKYFHLNPRKKFRKIVGLAASIRQAGRQTQPGIVRLLEGDPDYDAELVDGERRIRACKILRDEDGVWMFRAFPNRTIRSTKDHFREAFIANFCKEDHDCIEIARGIQQLIDDGETYASVANMAGGKSLTWVSQHLSLLKLDPKVQEMLVPGENEEEDATRRLSFSLALQLVSYPAEFQLQTANEITAEKMTMVKARRHILQKGRSIGRKALVSRKRPNAGFMSLMQLTENVGDRLGVFLDMNEAELVSLLGSAPQPAKELLINRLQAFEKDLAALRQTLQAKCKPADVSVVEVPV